MHQHPVKVKDRVAHFHAVVGVQRTYYGILITPFASCEPRRSLQGANHITRNRPVQVVFQLVEVRATHLPTVCPNRCVSLGHYLSIARVFRPVIATFFSPPRA